MTHYRYDQHDNLAKVIAPDNTPDSLLDNPYKQYHYNDAHFAQAITGITNHEGDRLHYMAYDDKGRAILSALGDMAERVNVVFTDADSNGVKRSIVTNALGKRTSYAFDKHNKPLDIQGHATESCIAANQGYTYNDDGLVISKIDWNDAETQYDYNDRGLETLRIEAVGSDVERRIETAWHTDFRLPVKVVEASKTTFYRYNQNGLLVKKTVRDTSVELTGLSKLFAHYPQRTWSYHYETNNNEQVLLTRIDGPLKGKQDSTRFEYDAEGNRIAVVNALGHRSETLAFNERGLPTRIKDANGVETHLSYNERGWLSSQSLVSIDADGETHQETTRYTYTGESDYLGNGLVETVTMPNGQQVHYEYNKARKVVAQSNNAGERIEYTLDLEGNIIAETILSSNGDIVRTQSRIYDEMSRMLQNLGADQKGLSYTYDKAGNVVEITDELNAKTRQAYDALNRLVSTHDASGIVAQTYDAHNRITSVTDQRELTTEYRYNGFGDKIAQISPDTGTTTFEYNEAGQLITKVDARGEVTQFSYDVLSRITDIRYPNDTTQNVHYSYDARPAANDAEFISDELNSENLIGRVAYVKDASGFTHYSYNHRGQVTQQDYRIGDSDYQMAYNYDQYGQLDSTRYPGGRVVNYERDNQGMLMNVATISSNGTSSTLANNFSRIPFGPLAGLTYGNGSQLNIKRDQDYRITDIAVTGNTGHAANDVIYDVGFTYDAVSNITEIADFKAPQNSQRFVYDNSYRLSHATGQYGEIAYQYDGVGNRLSRNINGEIETYAYAQDSNRLLTVVAAGSDGTTKQRDLNYDAVGNIISDSKFGDARDLHYGANNRLTTVEISDDGTEAHYVYNAKGQRVSKTVNGETTHFHYNIADQLIAETTSKKAVREFMYGVGQRLAMVDHSKEVEALLFVVNDHLGTPQVLTDTQQAVVWSSQGTPFGEMDLADANVKQPLRFPGQYADFETGYSYNYFRDYDPSLGRYIQSDPIGLLGGVNTFGYVSQDPNRNYDIQGLSERDVLIIDFLVTEKVFNEVQKGQRSSFGGSINNIFYSDNGCIPQACSTANMLKYFPNFDDNWTFTVRHKHPLQLKAWGHFIWGTEEGLLPHKWVVGISDNPDDPILMIDPWAGATGEIKKKSIDREFPVYACP